MQGVIAKAKKLPKQQPEFKAEVEAFEERLLATAVERKEEEATTEVLCLISPRLTTQSSDPEASGTAMPELHPTHLSHSHGHMPMVSIGITIVGALLGSVLASHSSLCQRGGTLPTPSLRCFLHSIPQTGKLCCGWRVGSSLYYTLAGCQQEEESL